MQLSVNKAAVASAPARLQRRLADLLEGEAAVLESINLPDDFALRLMELGFIPGMSVTAARCAPGGDPRVFRVDGSEIALRRETAAQLLVKM